ncbi:hypothetical protein G6F46_009053 [Rhizopus delemar]|nr:hypothetical protein G6F55_005705 [Rhizopus delemar]KAG1539362.1 hypothetical protein G6F51_009183 [Rhizopus arrhizus]KAG1493544.1 hypothetical protein G6F54_008500 [Rhizopus delemar]KAG1507620.1 hypothetical protein G6F53_008809 [Rhizopus delemar]KAG1522137.1 hypothetical protein G6F52_006123 [Rhizopus delemar]
MNKDDSLEEFMQFIGANQELKLFQQHSSSLIMSETINNSFTLTNMSLSHFRNIQEAYNLLSTSSQQRPQGSFACHIASADSNYDQFRRSPFDTQAQEIKMGSKGSHVVQSAEDDNCLDYMKEYDTTVYQSPLKYRPITPTTPFMSKSNIFDDYDDSDSLVFEMSEIGENIEEDSNDMASADYISRLKGNRVSLRKSQ